MSIQNLDFNKKNQFGLTQIRPVKVFAVSPNATLRLLTR